MDCSTKTRPGICHLPPAPPKLNPIAAPLNSLGMAARWVAFLAAVLITGTYAIASGMRLGSFFHMSDIVWYIHLASGKTDNVMQPFASRQLGPAVVRLLAWMLHWTVQSAFVLQGTASLIVMLGVVYFLMVRTSAPGWILAAVAVVPFWPQLYYGLVLPDIWYAALISIFLLLLARRHFLAAACMMFPLMVSRESTSLVLVCFLLAGWRPLRWSGRLLALGSALAGTVLVQHLTAHNPGNKEHLPESIYLFSKVPWNFLRNVAGVDPWSNVYPELCRVPVWQHSVKLGPIHAIGVCGYPNGLPVMALLQMASVFGLLPLLGGFLWWRSRRQRERSLLLNFCLLYGGVSLVLAPLLGVAISRLFGYGWPFCLIALPLLFDDVRRRYGAALTARSGAAGVGFLGLHVAACALTIEAPTMWAVAAGVGLWVGGYGVLRWWFGATAEGAGKRLQGNPAGAVAEA